MFYAQLRLTSKIKFICLSKKIELFWNGFPVLAFLTLIAGLEIGLTRRWILTRRFPTLFCASRLRFCIKKLKKLRKH